MPGATRELFYNQQNSQKSNSVSPFYSKMGVFRSLQLFIQISNCCNYQNSLERLCACPELHENCFTISRTRKNRPASHPFSRKWAFFGVYNYLNKFLIVVIIRTLWKGFVHARSYTRTVLQSAELAKIAQRLTLFLENGRFSEFIIV